MKEKFKEYADRQVLVNDLAERIGRLLKQGVKENGRASLAVSGGSTPVDLFERLSILDIPWLNVVVTLVDERWVEPTASDSNENLVRTHLLKNRAVAAVFIGMKNSAKTAREGERECKMSLEKISLPFDVLILGLGSDGHTASLFPYATRLDEATDLNSGRICMGIMPLTAPHERMTLTLPAILDAKQIFLHIVGQEKKKVFQAAQADGPSKKMPIRFILREQKSPVDVYWAP